MAYWFAGSGGEEKVRGVIDGNGTDWLRGGIGGVSRWMRSSGQWEGGRVAWCGGVAFTGWVWCVTVLC